MKKVKVLLVLAIMLISAIFCSTMIACAGDGDSGVTEKITITYYVRQDSAPLTVKAKKYEEFKFSLHNLKRSHYTFAGMYEEPNGNGNMIIDETGRSTSVFTDNITLYVFWIPATYTVEFDAGEGAINDNERTKNVEYGTNIGILPSPTLEGFDFDGWFIGENRISTGSIVESDKALLTDTNYILPAEGNLVLTARYKVKEYTVTFNYNDGRVNNDTAKVQHGQEIPFDLFPQEDTGSKILVAWSTTTNSIVEFTGTVTSDVTLYAFWKRYKTLYFNDGINEEPKEEKLFENEPFTTQAPNSRDGYIFKGWYVDEYFRGDPVTTIRYVGGSQNTEFYARWDIIEYELTLETNGGTYSGGSTDYTIETEDFELPTPLKDNYTFIGWCKESDLSDTPITTIVKGTFGVTELYAKYKGEDKTLMLDAGDGVVSPTSQTVEYGTYYQLPIPTYNGFVFIGWFDGDSNSANKVTDDDGTSLSPLTINELQTTLYAHYMEKLYIETEINIEKAGSVSVKEYYLEGEEVTLKATLNTGYSFVGWYEYGNLVSLELTYEFTMGASWLTLELRYEANKYMATLVPGTGASCEESQVELEYGSYYLLPVPTRPGYTFIGWQLNGKVITDASGSGLAPWDKANRVNLTAYFVEEDPNSIYVYDARSFVGMAQNPSGVYSLVSEIDMAGIEWTPFDFNGTLKGNGLVIKNLTITTSSGGLGVFKKFSGNLSNITFENLTVTSTSYSHVSVGGICAEMTGGTLNNVTVKGSVTGDYCRIGGLVGYMSGGTISNSINKANVKTESFETSNIFAGGIVGHYVGGTISQSSNYGEISSKRYTGGIIGYATATGYSDLVNYGKVTGDYVAGGVIAIFEKNGGYTLGASLINNGAVSGTEQVGGIFGRFNDRFEQGYNNTTHNLKISNLTNNGKIDGTTYVAGVIGYLDVYTSGGGSNGCVKVTITTIANTGNVTGTTYVGGLIGRAYSDTGESSISNSTSNAVISADAYAGGLAGRLENVKLISCSNQGSTLNLTGFLLDGSTSYAYIGGYVGYGYYIEDCHNAVEIDYNEGGIFVGGVAGRINSTIKNSSNTANVTAGKSNYVGGLVGELGCAGGYEIVQLSNTGNVVGKDNVGGLIGKVIDEWDQGYNDTTHNLKLMTLTNSGEVKGVNHVGGIIGYIHANTYGGGSNGSVLIKMTALDNSGDITGKTYVGGLIGRAYSDNGGSSINGSSSSANITAECYVGGLAGRLENVRLVSSSNENSTVTATGYYLDGTTYYGYVGGYVGYGYYVEDCDNAVEINYTKYGLYVGGIAGRLLNTIKNCTNSASITAENSSYVGGLVGDLTCNGSYEISTLTNSGNVVGKNNVGGIIGRIIDEWDQGYNNTTHNLKLMMLDNSGKIVGVDYVGGITGLIHANTYGGGSNGSVLITMTMLTNNADITGKTYVGGLIGKAYSDNGGSSINGSSSSANITAECYVGGLAGRLESIRLVSSSNENSTVTATGYYLDGTTYYGYVGGYVGYGYYVEDCHNAVEINYTKNGLYVGGIAGRLLNNTIKNCTNSANVTAENSSYVGGLVGDLTCNGGYEISTLTNSGNVTGKNNVGGLVGRVIANWDQGYNNTTHNIKIMLVNNSGEIVGESNVGGLVGSIHAETYGGGSNGSVIVTMTETENSGNITATGTAGAFVGSVKTDNGASKVEYYTYSGNVNGEAVSKEKLFGSLTNFTVGTEQ